MKFTKRNPLIILIAGRAGSGKSTLANYFKIEYELKNKLVIVSPYTKYLKSYIEEITKQKITDDNKPRGLLQKVSSEVIKGELNRPNFFVDRQIEDIEFYSYFADVVLVPDVRFPKEIEVIKEKFCNVVSIGITRKNYISTLTKEQLKDITETALDNYHDYDFELENTNGISLQEVVKNLIVEIEERCCENEYSNRN